MMEYPIQRYYRDARITSIYEGTTQLQVVAAIRYVTNGSYLAQMREFETAEVSEALQPILARAKAMADKFEELRLTSKRRVNLFSMTSVHVTWSKWLATLSCSTSCSTTQRKMPNSSARVFVFMLTSLRLKSLNIILS